MIDTLPRASDTSPTTGDYSCPPAVVMDVERQNSSVAELRLEPRHLDSSLCLIVTCASPPTPEICGNLREMFLCPLICTFRGRRRLAISGLIYFPRSF